MRTLLKTVCVCLCAALPMAAHAQSVKDEIIADLVKDGYTEITVSRTLLGRLRFIGVGQNGTREVVVQPSNGAILRDHVDDDDDERTARTSGNDDRGGSGSTAGSDDSSGSGDSGSASDDSGGDDGGKDDGRDEGHGGKDDDKSDDKDNDRGNDRDDGHDNDRGRDR
ncbi:hypothetical protein [Donghicola mangrovi]|uniref:PepSY domain-containing protein n=1 Tax=Donghicola mangrovi TaxID=2729614 RepID=A0A850QFF8_9RHOB|nr:hypothetical protein [Donghicola mangrovi]NVO25115.1 hypothetical protein [Donghicola mangrovi]